MNKDVQDNVLSNVLTVLSDYSDQVPKEMQSIHACPLAELFNDSLSVLEIIYELEDRFQVTIRAENLKYLHTVSDLANALSDEIGLQR